MIFLNRFINHALFKIKILPNITVQEKKRQRNCDLFNAETKPKFLSIYIKQRFFLKEEEPLREKEEVEDWAKNEKRVFAMAFKMESLGKHANELKVHEKTVWRAIKQYSGPDFKSLDYAILGFLENQTNANSHPKFGFFKIVFLKRNGIKCMKNLKACESFWSRVGSIIEKKKWGHNE